MGIVLWSCHFRSHLGKTHFFPCSFLLCVLGWEKRNDGPPMALLDSCPKCLWESLGLAPFLFLETVADAPTIVVIP